MKKLMLLLAVTWACCMDAVAQMQYCEASQLKVIGRPADASDRIYTRLPDSLKGHIRDALWNLGQNTAGLAVRFRTNATTVGAKWKNHAVFNMNHMTPTGIRGLDLYCLQDDGTWTFVNSARPRERLANTSVIIENMTCRYREYMLYLPLYEGLDSLEIGVNQGADITMPYSDVPRQDKPVVWYGTSITQGGCANRPGMAATNIVERKLNRVVVNLGFSGNGHLDCEIARIMAHIDAGMYIMDMLPNVTNQELTDRIEPFYRILREAHPNTPILLVETPEFPHMRFNVEVYRKVTEKNATLLSFYKKFRKAGDKQVFFVSTAGMIGTDHEGTVDGNHFTDLGFERCAEYMTRVIKKHLPK